MKLYQSLGIVGTLGFVSLIGQPVQAANTEIINIKSEAREESLQLTLDGVENGETIPNLTTFKQGKTLIASLPNVSLQLDQNFRQKNPYPGITEISVHQGLNNELQIKVTGEKQAPQDSILLQQNGDLILGFTTENNRLLAQNTQTNSPSETNNNSNKNDVLIPNPKILIDGQPASDNGPQFLPRAVAPPVGDIAVSNINSTPAMLNVGANLRVPRLVLKDASVREVLALLARSAGFNVIFAVKEGEDTKNTISLDINDELLQDVFNSVLLIADLQANLKGNTIFIGEKLPQQARNLVTRTFRLNQIKAVDAGTFLAAHGATSAGGATAGGTAAGGTAAGGTAAGGAAAGAAGATGTEDIPLLLKGVSVVIDPRLNTVTVIAEPRQMEIASSMLVQLDARRRQVAINVKVIDVNLLNTEDFNSSLSFGVGDGFFVSDNGAASFSYSDVLPPNGVTGEDGIITPPVVGSPITGDLFIDPQPDAPFGNTKPGNGVPYSRPSFGTKDNPFQPGVSEYNDGEFTLTLPSFFQYPSKFLALLEAQVQSGNGKVLTDPTLVVQEGQKAEVKLTQQVFGGFTRRQSVNQDGSSSIIDEPIIKDAGLTLNLDVDKIDDNGFISVNIKPVISGISGSQNTAQGVITLTQERSLDSGTIRLRDGQTLILSGIIQESDRTTVSKVPILGDIPLLGALFRSTNRQNSRNEVVVLVTPQIIDDSDQSRWGYNYSPGKATADVLKKQGF